MSYSSRVYRQRNPKVQEESKEKPFFPKQKSTQKGKGNSFFQAKPSVNIPGDNLEKAADSVGDKVVNRGPSGIQKKEEISIRRQAAGQGDPLKEKETTIQKKAEDDKKEIKKKAEPVEEKDKDKPKETTA